VESPERLGKYPLLGIIGTGSMAVVYKSIDPDIGRAVALKTIRHELLDDEIENFPARLRIEAEAAGSLAHPCIVRTYEYGEADGYAYIAMEYVEGHSLRDCFESQVRFNTEQAINIVSQLLKALQYAHLHGVWHRDVKPANILLVTDGLIKVTDFGIARVESLSGSICSQPAWFSTSCLREWRLLWAPRKRSCSRSVMRLHSRRPSLRGSPHCGHSTPWCSRL
jgi:eukaryotic-like serine/threonine-protein kinase